MKARDDTFFLVDENFIKHHPIINNYFSYLPSESSKNLSTIIEIIKYIPENTKSIFVMGGGITLDIGGFIAGLLNLPVHYLPTTLLSAVDAAVGGKTGVNFSPYGKNQIGLFYESNSLYFDAEFLSTLSLKEKLCGVVEAAKHSYLFGEFSSDKSILNKIIDNTISNEELTHFVNKNFQYKSRVVQLDPQEKNGIRANLNFGHTLAHVLEALAEEEYIENIPHGIAVAHGIKFLFDTGLISEKDDFLEFINKILINYPITLQKHIPSEVIHRLLSQDKKNTLQEKCTLSLPQYGCFTENATKEFAVSEISQKIIASMK